MIDSLEFARALAAGLFFGALFGVIAFFVFGGQNVRF
jgi:uncharacterized membrane protein YgaE (UPF0421/DUF939 family)